MIPGNPNIEKGANEYLEQLRQKLGYGHSDRAETRSAKKELGKDDFIKLMSTQLKYQDPTSPLKNEEMAAQLAQFSSLEQMSNVNRNLEKMTNASNTRDSMMAASLIGKQIKTDTSQFKLDEDRNVKLAFEVVADADKVNVAVVDRKGEVIRELTTSKMPKGKQELKWDGRLESGSNAELGEYSFRVTAYDQAGKPIETKTANQGIIDGVEFDKGRVVLLVGENRVYLDTVSKIENPGAQPAIAKEPAASSAAAPTASVAVPPVPENKAPASAAVAPNKNTADVKANQPMILEDTFTADADVGESKESDIPLAAAIWNPNFQGGE